MPTPTALDNARTSTPDGTNGIQLATIVAQEGTIEIPAGVMLSSRIAANVSADRSDLSADDTGTTDMSTSGFGSTGLQDVNNCSSLVVWCKFANSAGSATVEVVFYDAHSTPNAIFISRQLTFVALPQTSASSIYMSNPQIIDTMGASKYRCYLRVKGTGNVHIYASPL